MSSNGTTSRRQFVKAGAALAAVGPALARGDVAAAPLAGPRLRPRAGGRRPARPGTVRHRAGRGLVHDRDDDRVRRARPQLRPRPGRLHLGGERPRARRACGPRDARGGGRGAGALPFVDVLYIRCDWRDVQGRPGRLDLAPGVGGDPRRRAPPRPARRLPRAALEPRDPARAARPARLPAAEDPARHPRGAAAAGRARSASSRATTIPEFQRAFRELNDAARRRARRRSARRVRGPHDVRLLGRGAHERLARARSRTAPPPSARSST